MPSPKRSTKITDEDINEVPKYNRSASGIPYLGRADNARGVKANFFKISKRVKEDVGLVINVPLVSNLGDLTVLHNLGFIPVVIGSLKTPGGEAIILPYSTGLEFAEISSITNDKVELSFRAEFANRYELFLYLLRPPI